MSSQPTSETWDGGVDLRTYVDVFARHKWLIVGLIVVALTVAAVLSYAVLSPSYESSVVVALPVADGTNGLGMAPRGYEEFAGSAPVLDSLKQKLGLEIGFRDLRDRFDISLEPNASLLNVKASAGTAEEAKQLALGWADAYGEQALTLIEGQLAEQKAASQPAVGKLLGDMTTAEDVLAAFDQQNPISLTEASLSSMEGELVNSEATLRQLTTTSIPTDEARAAFLESALNKATSQKAAGKLLGDLTTAENVLAAFDQQNSISLMEARLSSMERELVNSEASLRQLTTTSIPIDEVRAAFLESALNKESRTLSGPVGSSSLPGESGGAGVTSNDVTLLNPVYLQLSQDLTATRTRLAANAREAQALRERISPLQLDIEQLRTNIVEKRTERQRLERQIQEATTLYQEATQDLAATRTRLAAYAREAQALRERISPLQLDIEQLKTKIVEKKTERQRLDRQVQEATAIYQQANTGLEGLLATERRLSELARPDVVRQPVLPESPVAPRKSVNMAIGGLAGVLMGLVLSLILEWSRITAPASVAPGRRAAPVASSGENAS